MTTVGVQVTLVERMAKTGNLGVRRVPESANSSRRL